MAARKAETETQVLDPDAGIELDIDMADLDMALFSKRHVAHCRRMASLAALKPEEFVLVMRKAKLLNADPLNGDLYVRMNGTRVNVMSSIAGMRTYAKQTGEYAGDDRPPDIEYSTDGPSPNNPAGIHSCTVGVYRFVQGEFRYHSHTVFWHDYVPLYNGQLSADNSWATIPFVMISKVAEAGALRKAFPELGSTYVEEEMARVIKPAQAGEEGETFGVVITSGLGPTQAGPQRMQPQVQREFATPLGIAAPKPDAAVGREDSIFVNWLDGNIEQKLPVSQYYNLVNTFLQAHLKDDPAFVVEWFNTNMTAREQFWAADLKLTRSRDATKLKSLLSEAQKLARAREEGLLADGADANTGAPEGRQTRRPRQPEMMS